MGRTPGAAQLKISDVVGLPPFLEAPWTLLTPTADLSAPVRWVHTIDDPRPAALLQGQEFVLSTLSRFTEDRADLVASLRTYLNDLDSVKTSALAVEVLSDRPQLLQALHAVVEERQSETGGGLPIVLFTEQVRFVDITEHFHRFLVARHVAHESSADSYDPLFEASTHLIGDIAAGQLNSTAEAASRSQVLGMATTAHYRSLVLRFRPRRALVAAERSRAQELVAQAVRAVASRSQTRALAGEAPSKDLGILLALPHGTGDSAESTFCLALRRATEAARAPDSVPAFVITSGNPSSTILGAVSELESAHHIQRSLETILPRSEHFSGLGDAAADRGYWKASDLGSLGLLARLNDPEAARWFVAAQLGQVRGPSAPELRSLIRALASPTGTKAELASQLGISRPTLYSRMRRLERLIGRKLNDDVLQALHLALLVEDLHC